MDKTKINPKAISLFSGAMGLDLGIEKSGFSVLACVENDKHCVETIKLNRPNVKIYAQDINQVEPSQILGDLSLKPGEVDLVFGGPPCQPFSTAGKRRGFEDFRGNVIIRFLDYIKEIKPKYFLLENVRGIYSAKLANLPPEYSDKYAGITNVQGGVVYFLYKEFENLGYSVSFNLYDASYYSVPQKRERFVMIGSIDKTRVAIPVPTSKDQPMTLRDAISHLDSNQVGLELREKHKDIIKLLSNGQNWKDLPDEIQKEAMGKSYFLGGGKTGFYRRLDWNKPSPTLVTHPAMPATMLAHPDKLRPLNIQEYAAIQQFPDGWKFNGRLEQIYKQIGNAVPVNLGKIFGNEIIKHMTSTPTVDYQGETSRYKGLSYKEFIKNFEREISDGAQQELPLERNDLEFTFALN